MHQLWQHQNGYWYVLHGPRLRRQISTKTKDRREAEKFLARFIAVEGEPGTTLPTVGAILASYQADKATRVRSPESMRFAVQALQPLKDLFPTQLTPKAIRDWTTKRKVSAGTVLREVGVLRAALKWAVEHQQLTPAQLPIISNPVPTPPSRRRWLTKTEAKTLLAACREPHMRVFIMLGLHTLARSGAILEAKWSQVNWERAYIDYGQGHGNKRRQIVKLNSEILSVLEGAHRVACSDFIVEYRGEHVHTVKTGFAATVRRARLSDDVTPHVLRHSGASWLIEAGIPEDEVARMLGDTVQMVRKVYGHFGPDYLTAAANALKLGTDHD